MEITEEEKNSIAYGMAQRRIKSVKSYMRWVLGFVIVSAIFIFSDYRENNVFGFSKLANSSLMIIWAVWLALYGIYLFVPYFSRWEEDKIRELTMKNKQKFMN